MHRSYPYDQHAVRYVWALWTEQDPTSAAYERIEYCTIHAGTEEIDAERKKSPFIDSAMILGRPLYDLSSVSTSSLQRPAYTGTNREYASV